MAVMMLAAIVGRFRAEPVNTAIAQSVVARALLGSAQETTQVEFGVLVETPRLEMNSTSWPISISLSRGCRRCASGWRL